MHRLFLTLPIDRQLATVICDIVYTYKLPTQFVLPPGPSPVKNPPKLKGKQHTNYPRSEDVTTAIEKNPGKDPPAIVFSCSGSTVP